MQKNKGHPLSMNEFEITMKCDLSFPLILSYQLFWFSEKVTEFLKKQVFFKASNGVIIGALDDFTYERTKMEGRESIYLLGFGSNTSSGSFKELQLLCLSEEEKLTIHKQITLAIHDLVDAVQGNKDGSSYMSWCI